MNLALEILPQVILDGIVLGFMVFGYIYLRGFNPWERFKDYRDRRRLARLKRRFQIHTGGKDDGPMVH